MLQKYIDHFQEEINKKDFYKAHEVLEELWFPRRRDKSDFTLLLKGFINGAVSMELYKKGRKQQSKKIYQIYLKYVTPKRISRLDNFSAEFLQLKKFMDQKFQKIL